MATSAPGPRPPTIADVARVAGVSRTTVSHALNGLGKVDPRTRERVRQVAA
ncbi:LacI family DNA-binding transcriptional regulator, partial [Streptomyces sp. A475]